MLTLDGETSDAAQHAHVALQINAYNIAREQPFVCQNLYLRVKITQVWNGNRARFASRETNRASGIVVADTCAKIGPISTIYVYLSNRTCIHTLLLNIHSDTLTRAANFFRHRDKWTNCISLDVCFKRPFPDRP